MTFFTEVDNILLRLVEEFEQAVIKMLDGSVRKTEEAPGSDQDDMQKIQELMLRLVHAMDQLVSANKTPVLVLDGLDKISTISQIRKVKPDLLLKQLMTS